jgi:hypothetical protein
MHFLIPTGEIVLIPGVALSFEHPRLAKTIFPVIAPYNLNCVREPLTKPNKTKI